MTKTEAQDIITKAIAAEGPIAGTLSIDAFAQRIATSLDALGLLQFCDLSEPEPAPIADTGAKSPGSDWASTRQRT